MGEKGLMVVVVVVVVVVGASRLLVKLAMNDVTMHLDVSLQN